MLSLSHFHPKFALCGSAFSYPKFGIKTNGNQIFSSVLIRFCITWDVLLFRVYLAGNFPQRTNSEKKFRTHFGHMLINLRWSSAIKSTNQKWAYLSNSNYKPKKPRESFPNVCKHLIQSINSIKGFVEITMKLNRWSRLWNWRRWSVVRRCSNLKLLCYWNVGGSCVRGFEWFEECLELVTSLRDLIVIHRKLFKVV